MPFRQTFSQTEVLGTLSSKPKRGEDALPEAQGDAREAQTSPARKQSLLEQLLQPL